jgi:hypothetical protein
MAPTPDRDPPLLDDAILTELERRWRDQGAFVAHALRPGLIDAEMDRLTSSVGLRLPGEARRWWGWHDGAEPQYPGVVTELGPQRAFLSLAEAVTECQRIRAVLRKATGGDSDPRWSETWLPINDYESPLVIDCGVRFSEPVPVRAVVFQEPDGGPVGTRSMGELVRVWIEAMDSGAWWYNRDRDCWEFELTKVKPNVAGRNLV